MWSNEVRSCKIEYMIFEFVYLGLILLLFNSFQVPFSQLLSKLDSKPTQKFELSEIENASKNLRR